MRAPYQRAIIALGLSLALTACARGAQEDPARALGQAAAEATAIVQRAQATALIQQAQAQATALLAGPTATQAPATVASASETVTPTQAPPPADAAPAVATAVGASDTAVIVTSVGLAADGGFVIVNFLAPPQVASGWYQGAVSVTDEGTGAVYSEIPVMPVVGPLFGRPVEAGQPGYVMLVNRPTPLRRGAAVTVVLGEYRFEHLLIE